MLRKGDDDDNGNIQNDNSEVESLEIRNNAWANSFAKVLQQSKAKDKKYLVLSKSKKLKEIEQIEKQKENGFEIDGEVKEEKPDTIKLNEKMVKNERKNKLLALRTTPSLMDRDRERLFKKIATKGVVQLFNAVRAQQKDLKRKLDVAGPLDHKRDAVLNNINKRKFLDVLMGGSGAKSEMVDNPVKQEHEDRLQKPSEWSVLRDDFMTNKKLSHWDKDDDDDDDDYDDNNNDQDDDDKSD